MIVVCVVFVAATVLEYSSTMWGIVSSQGAKQRVFVTDEWRSLRMDK